VSSAVQSNVESCMEMDIRRVTGLFSQQSVCNVKVNCGDYTEYVFTLPFGREN
jgi:hypothetical protein